MTKLTIDEVKKIYKEMMSKDEVVRVMGGVGGTEFRITKDKNGTIAIYGSHRYKIQGEKRVKVDEIKTVAKAKKKSEPKPATTSVKCSKCGKKFDRSKFNPNQTECPVCRGSKSVPKQDIEKKCDKCGKPFTCSKFTPKKTTCPDCMKLARRAKKASEKPAKATKPAKSNKTSKVKDGIPKLDV